MKGSEAVSPAQRPAAKPGITGWGGPSSGHHSLCRPLGCTPPAMRPPAPARVPLRWSGVAPPAAVASGCRWTGTTGPSTHGQVWLGAPGHAAGRRWHSRGHLSEWHHSLDICLARVFNCCRLPGSAVWPEGSREQQWGPLACAEPGPYGLVCGLAVSLRSALAVSTEPCWMKWGVNWV